MKEFLQSTPAQVVIWTSVLLIVTTLALYVVGRFRDRTGDDQLTSHDLLTNFRDLYQQGDIEDAEFRDIKTVLGTQIQSELKDTDETG